MSILDTTCSTEEAWFRLSEYINSQNICIWATENPHSLHDVLFNAQKISVWCAVLLRRIARTLFLKSTLNGAVYTDPVLQFVALLEMDKCDVWSQQDGANSHTANKTRNMIRDVVGDHLTSKIIWPPHSPDLNLLYFFL